jgi:hypothetical protein
MMPIPDVFIYRNLLWKKNTVTNYSTANSIYTSEHASPTTKIPKRYR